MDDTMRQFLSAVLAQARSCLPSPGLSVTHKQGVTAPDEVLKYIKEGKGAAKLTETSPAAYTASPKVNALLKILFTIQACEEAEIMDAVIQLDYFLSTIKLACLVNK